MDSQRSFLVMYKTYSAALYGVILRLVEDEAHAKQILEDTFMEAWITRNLLPMQKLKPFSQLHVIARRLSKLHLLN